MIAWENEYINNFLEKDEIQEKVRKLWIYYHVHTEEFDKKLRYTHPSPDDPNTVIPYGSSMTQSSKNARSTMDFILEIKKHYGISDDIMMKMKFQISRMNYSTLLREFNLMFEQGELDFIFNYLP